MEDCKTLIREFFTSRLASIRKKLGLSQDQMSELLHITTRSYIDLEKGKYCLSTKSLMFLLLLMDKDEIYQLLLDFKEMIDKAERKDAM